MVSLRQSGFSGGLLSPQLLGRSDLAKYQSGLRTCRNFIVTRNGSIENRSGTSFTASVKNPNAPVRLVRFGSSVGQGLLLEFGAFYIRFYENGAPILHATSLGAWAIGTYYFHGQVVDFGGLQYYALQDGAGNTPNVSPTFWYVQPTSGVLELPTIIPQAALAEFQYVQINDLMYIVNQLFIPQVLSHFSNTNWTIGNFIVGEGINPPTGVIVTPGTPSNLLTAPTGGAAAGGGPAGTYSYRLTAFQNIFATEGPASAAIPSPDPSGGFPVTVTWNAVAGADGYAIYRSTDGGIWGIIGVTSSLIFTDALDEADADGATAIKVSPTGPGNAVSVYEVTSISATTGIESLASLPASASGAPPSTAKPNIVSWTPVTGASTYNVYKSANGVFGFIGSSSTTSFADIGITPAISQQPPVEIPMFQTTDDYPAVVGSYQQRLLFANTVNQPQTVWASAVGSFTVFTVTIPVLDSGSIQFTIAGRVRQYVQALVDIGKLVINTSNGEYVAYGNQFNAITPTAINLVQNGYAGSTLLIPVSIGSTALFVQARGNILRDLQYSIYSTTFAGKDTTLYAPQLFENQTITSMDWQQVYNSIIWTVQANGGLQAMTYIKDQEMWAWHTHDSMNGILEQVCVIPEGTSDIVYYVIKRKINGATARYIERMEPREFIDTQYLTDAIFTDSSLTYDGRNTTSITMTAISSGTWTPQDTLMMGASTAYFVAGDVGNTIILRQIADGTQIDTSTNTPYRIGYVIDQVEFDIIGYTSATVVTVQSNKDVPVWAQTIAMLTWGKAVHQFTDIGHLNGQTISAQGDGSVVFNAITDLTPTTVVGGAFTTSKNYMVLTAGLPITAQVQTLPWEGGGRAETMGNKQQLIMEVTATFYNSRSGMFGPDFTTAHLHNWKERGLLNENMNFNPGLFTGPTIIPIQGIWQTTGQVCIQQTDPLPMSISSLIPTGFEGS